MSSSRENAHIVVSVLGDSVRLCPKALDDLIISCFGLPKNAIVVGYEEVAYFLGVRYCLRNNLDSLKSAVSNFRSRMWIKRKIRIIFLEKSAWH